LRENLAKIKLNKANPTLKQLDPRGIFMSKIKIADLQLSGSDLFVDNESYLTELNDSSLQATQIQGGGTPVYISIVIIVKSCK
jgi:hypothetical protein